MCGGLIPQVVLAVGKVGESLKENALVKRANYSTSLATNP